MIGLNRQLVKQLKSAKKKINVCKIPPTTRKIVSALFSISSTVEVKVHFKHLYAKLVMLHVLLSLFSVSVCIGIIIPVYQKPKQQLTKYVLVQNESWKYFHFLEARKREACLRKLYQSYFFKTDSTLVVALTSLERRFGLSCFCCNCIFLFHTRFPKSKSAAVFPHKNRKNTPEEILTYRSYLQ